MNGLSILFSNRFAAGLLAANLVILFPFVTFSLFASVFDGGTVLGPGTVAPFTYKLIWSWALFGGVSCIVATLFLAVPVVLYLRARNKRAYADYIKSITMWVAILVILPCLFSFNISVMGLGLFIFAIIWVPAYIAATVFWFIAVRGDAETLKLFAKISFVFAFLIWCYLCILLGYFAAVD